MQLSHEQISSFQTEVWDYYVHHGRSELPWRLPDSDGQFDPYKIMVSELMLQQTQVGRVVPKFAVFMQLFPDTQTLAQATVGDVLRAWQGLGYNRRAKFLWQAATAVQELGTFPRSLVELIKLPGVGKNTAGAILAYAFNEPVAFIETNIRSVYLHHFFAGQTDVPDKELTPFIDQTLDTEHPRDWYWALMDYGSNLKATVGNSSRASKHFTRQSSFDGSRRQVRGQVIRWLTTRPLTLKQLQKQIVDARLESVLNELLAEGLISQKRSLYSLD